jgi:hypothetical protein
MSRKRLLAGLIAVALLSTAGLLMLRSAPSSTEASSETEDENWRAKFGEFLKKQIGATPATAADWKKAKVVTGVVRADGADLPWGFAANVLPLMEAEKNLHVSSTFVGVERSHDQSLTTRLWSAVVGKAAYTDAVDWRAGTIRAEPARESEGLRLDQMPPDTREVRGGNRTNISLVLSETKQRALIISFRRNCQIVEEVSIPYDYGDRCGDGITFLSASYPIAVVPKLGDPPALLLSFILVDMTNFKVVGEIPVPKEAQGTIPRLALDRDQDVLVATGYDLNWIFTIDLRPYVSKIRSDKAKAGEEGLRP